MKCVQHLKLQIKCLIIKKFSNTPILFSVLLEDTKNINL